MLYNFRKAFALAASILTVLSCGTRGGRYIQITGTAQSVTYSVKLNLDGVKVPPQEIRDSVDAILQRIDYSLSGYNRQSILSRFNAGEVVKPDTLFLEMYSLGYRMWKLSGGAVDCAAGPLYDAWGFGFKKGEFPTDAEISELLGKVGQGRLPEKLPVSPDGTLDPSALGYPKLNYNAIAQGYTSDVIARYLYGIGAKDMLVDIGEIWCDGVNPSGEPWAVGIDRPSDSGEEDMLQDIWSSGGKALGITTSGNYRKFYVRDGKKYSHTVSPITGYPVQHSLLSATIVSKVSSAESDAIATWCMVAGLEASKDIIQSNPDIEGYLVYAGPDGEMKSWHSAGFTLRN